MPSKWIHCSDLHLGRQRLGGKLPESDLAKALQYIVNYTIENQADGLLIAGDLFDSPSIQPPHLQMAVTGLQPLKDLGIPVVAIEGNHDRPSLSSGMTTWVRYLNDQGYLHLLTIPFTTRGAQITPWDPVSRTGSYLDIGGIRIIGAGYLGAGTGRRMKAIAEGFEAINAGQAHLPTIMLLHAGPEYIVHESGGYDQESIEFIRNFVDFLALGHIHKPLNYGWAVNPGTAENIRLEEAGYSKNGAPRGMAEIIIDESAEPVVKANILPVPRRPIVNLDFDCTALTGRNIGEKIQDHLLLKLRSLNPSPETIARINLTGALNLTRAGMDPTALAAFLEEQVPVIAADIVLTHLNQPSSAEQADAAQDTLFSRETIERQAIHQLLHDTPIPQLDDETLPEIVDLFMNLKEDVRGEMSPEDILDRLNRHPVVGILSQKLISRRAATGENSQEVAASDGGRQNAD